jgi:hypothetical protein
MSINDLRGVLRDLAERGQGKSEWIADNWIKHLEALMKNGALFAETANFIPLPMAVCNKYYCVVAANNMLFEETGFTQQNLDDGSVNIGDIEDRTLNDAIAMAFQKQTSIVNGLDYPFDRLPAPKAKDGKIYRSAIVFPCIEGDNAVTQGIVLFLPMDL